ncbi:hypothetical protein [Rathayibacter soli]|uniref:hypothetical protein n=1 Tax=Rathayibacter soli TaxID=3144168 RepID=UPI0027E4FAD0|nr:hypothetical protein [Glaciibacter superstes]
MTKIGPFSQADAIGWDAAAMLARTVPNVRRRATGFSWSHMAGGLAMVAVGLLGLVGSASLPLDMEVWRILLPSPSIAVLIPGLMLTMWAAPESAVRLVMRAIRHGVAFGRRVTLFLSFAVSVIALAFVAAAESTKLSASEVVSFYIVAFFLVLLGIGMAASTLPYTPAIVSVTTKGCGYCAGRTAMLAWCLACCITGTIVGAAAAHTLSSAAVWPSVTLALLGVFITVFAQRHKDLQTDISNLERSLAALHRELTASVPDSRRLLEACTHIEAALSTKPRGPFTLASQSILDYELEVTFLYLLAQATCLPVSEATSAESSVLQPFFAEIERSAALAGFTWSIRGRLLRSRR